MPLSHGDPRVTEDARGPLQGAEFATRAVAAMIKRAIPPVPQNFAVWYAYVAGSFHEIVRAVDEVIAGGGKFTAATNERLHERFFGSGRHDAAVRETGLRLEETMGKVLERLADATGRSQRYGTHLEDLSGKLESPPADLTELRQMIVGAMQQTRAISEHNRALEAQLGESAATISELKQKLERSSQEAMTDGLTGVANRKCFDLLLREAAERAVEDSLPLSLLMVDIDHFKKFNDSYGHQVGDQVLKLAARTLTQCVKGRDTVARYGGEEFAVLLPATRLEHAMIVAEQIRQAVANRKLIEKATGQSYGQITLSIGAAEFARGEAIAELVERSDQALYQAKRSGRNRVVSQAEIVAAAA